MPLKHYFFTALFLLTLGVAYLMLRPFVNVLLLAAVFSVVLRPAYHWLRREFSLGPRVGSVVLLILVAVVVLGGFGLILSRVLTEAFGLYQTLAVGGGDNYVSEFVQRLAEPLEKFLPGFSADFERYASQGLGWFLGHVGSIFSATASAVFKTILWFLALFFFLKDGAKLRQFAINLSPLNNKTDVEIIDRLKQTITAVMRGFLLVAVVQGGLVGVGFALFGVPNATLWGTVAALAALVPGVGTALVTLPAVVYLWWQGSLGLALGLLLWGALVVGLVDNLLAPLLYSRGGRIHPFLMLLAVLGGLSFFGPAGFILGPLVLSLLFSLMTIYERQALE